MAASAGRRAAIFLFVYFGLHLVLRLFVPSGIELDESELLILGQEWRWGYGSQPPLYVWLQKACFSVVGYGVFALALLKSLFLWALFFLVFRAVRSLGGRDETASVAMLSLFLIPQIAWEGQRDLSHTLAVLACTAATWWVGWRAVQSRRAGDYLALGVIAGLGVLSKYNYALFLIQFIMASLSLREGRAGFRSRWIWLSLVVFAAVVGPHLWWNARHPEELFAQAHKLQIHRLPETVAALWVSLWGLMRALAGFLALPLGVYWVVFGNPLTAAPPPAGQAPGAATRWMGRMVVAGALLCVALLLVTQMRFKQRWLLPILLCVPVFLSLRLEGRFSLKRLRVFSVVTVLLGLGYLAGLSVRPWSGGRSGQSASLDMAYASLADHLRKADFKQGVIAAENRQLGGNLKLLFPSSRVVVPELVALRVPEQAEWILVWNASSGRSQPPAPLLELARAYGRSVVEPVAAEFLETPSARGQSGTLRLGFTRIAGLGRID